MPKNAAPPPLGGGAGVRGGGELVIRSEGGTATNSSTYGNTGIGIMQRGLEFFHVSGNKCYVIEMRSCAAILDLAEDGRTSVSL